MKHRVGRRAAGMLALVTVWAPGAQAQTAEALATQCVAANGDPVLCALAAGAGRDLMGYVAVLSGPGSELPGQGSTLGLRLGGTPRIGAAARASGMSVKSPWLGDVAGETEMTHFVPAAGVTLGFGVYDGVTVLPTVGGLFSLDLLASLGVLFFPRQDERDQSLYDGRLSVFSLGGRVGLLRESFTLPAVTVSATRRIVGKLQLGSTAIDDFAEVVVDPSVTSVRATAGKDLFAFGVLVGMGWDWFSSATTVRATDGIGGFATAEAPVEESRRTYFAGISKQVGVLSWISAELGWVNGFDPVTGGTAASPDTGTSWYGSVALVLRL